MDPAPSPSARSLRPAPVLAGVGTFLLTAAAVSFVSARWDRFGPGDRFAVLLVASGLVFGVALGLRRIAPATSRSLEVLMAALVPVDVAALAIVSGASWPAVLLAAGPAAMVSAEVLRRRDPIAVAEVGTVVGGLLMLCGAAASYDVALAPLVAVLGLLACVASPWSRDRVAGPVWAGLAGLAPALRVLDEVAFAGDGTLRRLGLLDATPWTATLLAGLVALAALTVAAVMRRSLFIGAGGAAVAVATSAAMWAEHEPPRSLLIVAAAILVAVAEIGLTHPITDRVLALRDTTAAVLAGINAALTFVVLALATQLVIPESRVVGPEWTYGAATLAFAWLVADTRRMRDGLRSILDGGGWAPATWGAVVNILAVFALATTPTITGVAALSTGVAVLLTGRTGRLSVAWATGALAPLLLIDDWRLALAGAAVGTVLVASAAMTGRRIYDEMLGVQAVAGVALPIGAAIAAIGPHSVTLAGVAALVLAWLAATIVDVTLPSVALALRGAGLLAVTATAADDPTLGALALLATGLLWLVHLVATRQPSSVVVGAWSVLVAGMLLTVEVAVEPTVLLALSVAGIGATVLGWGIDRDIEAARFGGAFVIWWASLVGLAGAEVAILEPYLYPILLMLGWAIHREGAYSARSRWIAIGFPAALGVAVAFGQRIDGGSAGHTLLFGIIGLGVCVAGARRDHQPALVIGAAMTVAIGAFEAMGQVVGIESWSWLVVTGASALTIAAALELTDQDKPASA